MNKPEITPMLPGLPNSGSQSAPKALVQQPAPVGMASSQNQIPLTRPAASVGATAYVDPYLFEIGYYSSQAEWDELARAAASRIELRAEAENAPVKRRTRRPS